MALAPLSRVNEIVSIHSPAVNEPLSATDSRISNHSPAKESAGPHVILLLSWSDAIPRHVEKYIALYTAVWPEAEIIHVRSGMADFVYRTEQTSRRLVEPVVKMLKEEADQDLLVHVMSNAGSKQWCTINKSFSRSTGRTLSNATTILDSGPGRARFKQTWAALAGSLPKALLPRLALGFAFGIMLGVMHLASLILPGPDVMEVVRTKMNDPTGVVKGTRRSYIYSEEDTVVGSQDVEEHARDAEEKGWVVNLVKFPGSVHVGHLKQNPELYRKTIGRTWYGRPS